jgi:hypothetical protein
MRVRWVLIASLGSTLAVGGAPQRQALLDVWPYAAKRVADAGTEYSYDLRAAKTLGGSPDALAAYGEAEVSTFIRELPREVKVRVQYAPAISLSAGRGPETRALATAFAATDDAPLVVDGPLPQEEVARLRPPLHPLMPKLLPGVGMLLWYQRQLEDGALAAVELASEAQRREVWGKVLERALARAPKVEADAREGALALAARILVANACLDSAKLASVARANAALRASVERELAHQLADPDALVVQTPWSWQPELACVANRARAMARPFIDSRAGIAAVLTFLDLVEADPKLRSAWEGLRARQQRFHGPPAAEPILGWLGAAKGKPADAIEGMSEFLQALPMDSRSPPGLMGLSVSPFRHLLDELDRRARGQDVDELAAAVQDGRLERALAANSWVASREATLAAVVSFAADPRIDVESTWRAPLTSAFAWLQGRAAPGQEGGQEYVPREGERSRLRVRLMVPPVLEVEPLPLVFERAASSLERLARALAEERLTSLRALSPDGTRAETTLAQDVARLQRVMRGLALLAESDPRREGVEALIAARRFLERWASDPVFARDVRSASAAPGSIEGTRLHAALAGVTRVELVTRFTAAPAIEVVGQAGGEDGLFEVSSDVEQRYLVPTGLAVSASAPAAAGPLSRSVLRAVLDGAGRDPAKVEVAFQEAVLRAAGRALE